MLLPSDSPDIRALLHEKLDALLAECDLVIDKAEHGRTFHDLDDFFCTKTLKELCGMQLSHTTIGEIADRTSVRLADKMENNSDIREAFQQAKGETEFYTFATMLIG